MRLFQSGHCIFVGVNRSTEAKEAESRGGGCKSRSSLGGQTKRRRMLRLRLRMRGETEGEAEVEGAGMMVLTWNVMWLETRECAFKAAPSRKDHKASRGN